MSKQWFLTFLVEGGLILVTAALSGTLDLFGWFKTKETLKRLDILQPVDFDYLFLKFLLLDVFRAHGPYFLWNHFLFLILEQQCQVSKKKTQFSRIS